MDAIKYTCPECSAVLKVSKALQPGKKLRCPKCDTQFAPVGDDRPVAAPSRIPDDEEDGTPYKFAASNKSAESKGGKKKSLFEEPIKDRFTKSKRGPAMAAVVKPSNALIGAGLASCVGCLVMVIYYLFPIVFSEEQLNDLGERWTMIAVYVGVFVYTALIIKGAVDMQNLESYNWAVAASFMSLVPFTYWFYVVVLPAGIWCLMTMRKEFIKEGFMEKKPDKHPG